TTPGAPGANPDLPPLALVLDRSLPREVAALPPDEQVGRLRERADAAPSARRLTELGSALQVAGDPDGARAAYEAALRLAPGGGAARAGLAMVPGASGVDGMARASAGLAALAREHPESQLVAFNQGW